MIELAKRFWQKIQKTSGCWVWIANLDSGGYGQIRIPGTRKNISAHRLSFLLKHKSIPGGLHVLHKCDTRRCVRPSHLFLGTPADNTLDMLLKHRGCIGEKQGRSKLKERDVADIRRRALSGTTQRKLAAEYGVCFGNISMIVSKKTWKHI